jgi:hypothetical protein
MTRQRNPDGKQFPLPRFMDEDVPVPADRQKELEGALADLLLSVAQTEVAGQHKGGSR